MFRHFESRESQRTCGPHRGPGAHFARFGMGFGPREQRHGFGGGGGRERMFDSGEFQLVLLSILKERPSYGYELIKTLEAKLGGSYAPSPGVVYPTLTMLEEEGLTTAENAEGGRKVYTVTERGAEHLRNNQARVDEILGRLQAAGEGAERGRAPEIMRAFGNLRRAVFNVHARARMTRQPLTAEQAEKIAQAIDQAARAIDSL